jgi:hypothetical protein
MVVFGRASAASLSHAGDTDGVDPACALMSMTARMLNMAGILTSPPARVKKAIGLLLAGVV